MVINDLKNYYKNLNISIFKILEEKEIKYPRIAPFNPSNNYPEYPFSHKINIKENNYSYHAVRESLRLLKLDKEKFGKNTWNPFKNIIKSGDKVLIKPNFVLSHHNKKGDLFSIITHPSVIRAVIDYCFIALKGNGQIIIADAPQMDCNFNTLLKNTNLLSIQKLYKEMKGFEIKIIDLRNFWLDNDLNDVVASIEKREKLLGDPLGSKIVNLGEKSEFYEIKNWNRFYGADYNRGETIRHHHDDIQEYMISRTVLSSDVIISIPKLKVHKKTGVTLNAKGLVGINTNKNYLIHYMLGIPDEGGDQFPNRLLSFRERLIIKLQRILYDKLLAPKNMRLEKIYVRITHFYKKYLKYIVGTVPKQKRLLDGGNWYGNDTTWRMVVDLVKIIYFADSEGKFHSYPQRKIFSIIDGIIGGEKEGPLIPDSKKSGVVIAGFNPIAVDIGATRLMGFDWKKLKIYNELIKNEDFDFFLDDPNKIKLFSNFYKEDISKVDKNNCLNFIPPFGWEGKIEI